jgi:hypothetical protein
MTDLQTILVALVAALIVLVIWHVIVRDKSSRSRHTRWGVFVERDKFGDEPPKGEVWTVEPVPLPKPGEEKVPFDQSPTQTSRVEWPEKK